MHRTVVAIAEILDAFWLSSLIEVNFQAGTHEAFIIECKPARVASVWVQKLGRTVVNLPFLVTLRILECDPSWCPPFAGIAVPAASKRKITATELGGEPLSLGALGCGTGAGCGRQHFPLGLVSPGWGVGGSWRRCRATTCALRVGVRGGHLPLALRCRLLLGHAALLCLLLLGRSHHRRTLL